LKKLKTLVIFAIAVAWVLYYWLSYVHWYDLADFFNSSYFLGTAYLFLIPAIIISTAWYVLIKKFKEKNIYIFFFSVFFPAIPAIIFLVFSVLFLFFGFSGRI
jgi:hypothetical protein